MIIKRPLKVRTVVGVPLLPKSPTAAAARA